MTDKSLRCLCRWSFVNVDDNQNQEERELDGDGVDILRANLCENVSLDDAILMIK